MLAMDLVQDPDALVHHAAYLAPRGIDEALEILATYRDEAKVIAGGQSLLVFLRQGLLTPSYLVGLKQVPELAQWSPAADGGLAIGAMVTQHVLETSPLVRARFPALAEAAAAVASPQVRRQGTLGGNLCHADPTGDPPAALIALGAEVEIAHTGGRRRLPVEALFRDYMEPAIEPDELLVSVHLPPPPPRSGAAYLKHRLRGVDTALVGVGFGAALAEDGVTCADVRIGVVGAGTTPLRSSEAEARLIGRELTDEVLRAAAVAAAEECSPVSDTEAGEEYRREMVQVFVWRAAKLALRRTRGGESE
ncbi:MAG: xanthine dehydrogenase family protein subunit M [Thermomicrobiales bacterium]|nr:xanthine dehydrogenase family protein subunit M [Thermomicrobiales bacterium]